MELKSDVLIGGVRRISSSCSFGLTRVWGNPEMQVLWSPSTHEQASSYSGESGLMKDIRYGGYGL